jgi:hypothetical protein
MIIAAVPMSVKIKNASRDSTRSRALCLLTARLDTYSCDG